VHARPMPAGTHEWYCISYNRVKYQPKLQDIEHRCLSDADVVYIAVYRVHVWCYQEYNCNVVIL